MTIAGNYESFRAISFSTPLPPPSAVLPMDSSSIGPRSKLSLAHRRVAVVSRLLFHPKLEGMKANNNKTAGFVAWHFPFSFFFCGFGEENKLCQIFFSRHVILFRAKSITTSTVSLNIPQLMEKRLIPAGDCCHRGNKDNKYLIYAIWSVTSDHTKR